MRFISDACVTHQLARWCFIIHQSCYRWTIRCIGVFSEIVRTRLAKALGFSAFEAAISFTYAAVSSWICSVKTTPTMAHTEYMLTSMRA